MVLVCGRCELKRVAFETGDRAPEALRVRLKLKLREVVLEADAREYRTD